MTLAVSSHRASQASPPLALAAVFISLLAFWFLVSLLYCFPESQFAPSLSLAHAAVPRGWGSCVPGRAALPAREAPSPAPKPLSPFPWAHVSLASKNLPLNAS